ncbi:MAG: membrane-associated phospholipid phosphatase [Arenicella sp.]|jgi:membrane-associated phospholipid phosphatase
MIALLRSLLPFMVIALLFVFTGLTLVLITDKFELHLAINQQIGEPADSFFKYFTHVGDGITAVVLIVIVSLTTKNKIANGILGLSTLAISGVIAQLLKRQVFSDHLRPTAYFQNGQLKLVEGVDMHAAFSFPSGHSTASFALFIFLAFVFRKYRYVQGLCGIFAVLAAYSRVHISQHFMADIVVGACLGITIFFVLYSVLIKFKFTESIQLQE